MRIGLVGAGGMAGMHASCWRNIPGAELVGIFDIRPDASKSLASASGCRAAASLDALLRDIRPDIVDVCCPTPFHAESVIRAASAEGVRGIVTEKPMARSLEECDRMTAACAAAGIPLFVAQVVRFFPEFREAYGQIRGGAVGTPAAIRMRRGGDMPRGWNHWYGNYAMSGGCVLDLMVHDFDWLLWTLGEAERVYAVGLGSSELPERDFALVTIRFRSGAIAHVEGTWADPGGFKVQFEAAGDKGLLEYNFNQPAAAPLSVAIRGAGAERQAVAVPESPTAMNPYQAELQHFHECLIHGTEPDITPADGRRAVEIALAASRSIETSLPVSLPLAS